MMRRFSACLASVLCLLAVPAHADEVDDAIAAFVGSDGFTRQDPDAVEARIMEVYGKSNAMSPGGAVSPLEKALLLIDRMEPELPRVRYMVRYGQMVQQETPVSFVSVERYNMGPAIRKDTAESYGEENVEGPEAFGVGPHVAWRIVTMPMMGQTASIIEAARTEISEADAEAADCAGRGCLSLDMPLDFVREWNETPLEIDIKTAYPRTGNAGRAIAAFAAAELAVAAGIAHGDGSEPSWQGPEQPEAARGHEPFLFVTIDSDLGQETNVDAALGQTLLNDDSLEEIWVRRNQIFDTGDLPPYWLQSVTERTR